MTPGHHIPVSCDPPSPRSDVAWMILVPRGSDRYHHPGVGGASSILILFHQVLLELISHCILAPAIISTIVVVVIFCGLLLVRAPAAAAPVEPRLILRLPVVLLLLCRLGSDALGNMPNRVLRQLCGGITKRFEPRLWLSEPKSTSKSGKRGKHKEMESNISPGPGNPPHVASASAPRSGTPHAASRMSPGCLPEALLDLRVGQLLQ
jgi:hypothetical protein